MNLNVDQLRAAQNLGHTLVMAGPGTGKTATLVGRALYWLEQGVKPEEMLLLTFTRKAAEEMKERIQKVLLCKKSPFIGTIHGWCDWWLRTYRSDWGKSTLAKEEEIEVIVRDVLKETTFEGSVKDWILLISTARVGERKHTNADATVVQMYEQELRRRGLYDFDDLLLVAEAKLSGPWPEEFVGYKHVLVDEFQDVNFIQYCIVRHLLQRGGGVGFVVGDVHQGIYGFRGGSGRWIEAFAQEFRDDDDGSAAVQVELSGSYRCAQEILDVSGALFGQKMKLQSYARNPMHATIGKVFHITTQNERTEAYWTRKKIECLIGIKDETTTVSDYITFHDIPFSQIAIFYRTYQSSISLAKELSTTPLPFVVYGEKKFVDYGDVQRFMTLAEGVMQQTVDKGLSSNESRFIKRLCECPGLLLIEGVLQLIEFQQFPQNHRRERLLRMSQEWNREKFVDALPYLLDALLLLDEIDEYDASAESISIMSLHASKGLEFEVVFILGCEEGVLPHSRAIDSGGLEAIEEERRLLYVGITRAKSACYLLRARERSIYGEKQERAESRFLKDLRSGGLLNEEDDVLGRRFLKQKAARASKRREKERQGKLF